MRIIKRTSLKQHHAEYITNRRIFLTHCKWPDLKGGTLSKLTQKKQAAAGRTFCALSTWMSQEVSKWVIVITAIYPIYTHLLSIDPNFQRDVQVYRILSKIMSRNHR